MDRRRRQKEGERGKTGEEEKKTKVGEQHIKKREMSAYIHKASSPTNEIINEPSLPPATRKDLIQGQSLSLMDEAAGTERAGGGRRYIEGGMHGCRLGGGSPWRHHNTCSLNFPFYG